MGQRTRTNKVGLGVAARLAIARRMGEEMFHPAEEVGSVLDRLSKGQSVFLVGDEREAFDRLMPGPFRASFTSGWNTSKAAHDGV